MPPIRVLIFPAGEFNSAELCQALSQQVNIELYGASSIERLGRHIFENYRNDLPMIHEPGFLEAFNDLLQKWQIDLVIPTHDTVVEYFSINRAKIGTRLLLPDHETAVTCRDKALTMQLFAGEPFTPAVYTSFADLPSKPVFMKPKRGQGAQGAKLVLPNTPEAQNIQWETEIVCEYLPGEEVTVDCFTDRHGTLQGVFPRTRERVLGGITVSGRTLYADEEIFGIAQTINNRLKFLGLWFLQLKKAEDERWKLLEISARCSCTQCMTRARGVNLPLLSVYVAMNRDVMIFENKIPIRMERALTPMYDFCYNYSNVYLDYDDTLVHSNSVSPEVIGLIYQWRNANIRVFLITRHKGDLAEHMSRHSISDDLFSKVIHLTKIDDRKSDHIDPAGAIFIDNSFAERQQVHKQLGIPVFDVEGAQVLKRWKL